MAVNIGCLKHYFGDLEAYKDYAALTNEGRECDRQRGRLYAAETEVSKKIGNGSHYLSLTEAREFKDQVTNSRWWTRRFGYGCNPRIQNCNRSRYPCASYDDQIVYMVLGYCERFTILHELAHCIVPPPHAWHGRLFARVYLILSREFLGECWYKELKEKFDHFRVNYDPVVEIMVHETCLV